MAMAFPSPSAAAGVPHPSLCGKCEIRELAICGALDEDELAKLDRVVVHLYFEPGQTIFYEGDEPGYVFNVATGTLRLYKMLPDGRRQITGFVLPGDFVGLSIQGGFSYTAEAVTEAGVCRFAAKDLETLFDEFPQMEKRLLGKARDELVAAQEQMLLLGRKTPAEKLASFLLGLSNRAQRWGLPGSPVVLSMSRGDIADYLGLTIETVSRTITHLKADGIIGLPEAHHVILADVPRLEELAEGN
jgi:CRP/FNR family transcriptional regulator